MRYLSYTLIAIIALCNSVNAQEKWDLRKCVDYAVSNGFTIKQAELQTKLADIQYNQSKLSQYPSLNAGNSYGMSFGLRENPTTGIFENQRFFNLGLNLQSSANIFNWYSRKNSIAADQFEMLAARASVEKQKNDLSLLVANNYLTILLAKEQENIARVQLQQSIAQYTNTRKLVDAGSLPELNAAELEAQVARDTSSVISAKGNVQQAILNLKANLNLDAATEFDVAIPPVEMIPIDPIADLQPDAVFALAVKNLPQQQVNNLKYQAGEKRMLSSKGAMKPSISAFGNIGTNYVYFKTPVYERILTGTTIPTGLIVNTGTVNYPVLSPVTKQGDISGYIKPNGLGSQLSNNLGQNIGLNISVPIFNGSSLRSNYERSKVNLQSLSLQKDIDNQRIKQDIYLAYNSAIVALEKFNASKKSVETSQRSYDFAKKRYEVGMLPTLDLITNQNSLFRAKLEMVSNQFDYVFKMKVLEFYKGLGIKL
jgi:outer membrane protein